MKSLAALLAAFAFSAPLAAAGLAEPPPQIAAPGAVAPALYSFADVYRLTVGPAAIGWREPPPAIEAAVRVAMAEPAAAEVRFSVRQLPRADGWLLALAGLALAGWVAHRRLSYL